jgi:hypothetical protein
MFAEVIAEKLNFLPFIALIIKKYISYQLKKCHLVREDYE